MSVGAHEILGALVLLLLLPLIYQHVLWNLQA